MKRKRVTSKKKNLSKKELVISEANSLRPLYSLRDDVELHPELVRYDGIEQVRGMTLKIIPPKTKEDIETAVFLVPRVDGGTDVRAGLVNKIKKRYFPSYKESKRKQTTQHKGSGKLVGTTADKHLHLSVENKGGYPPRCSQYARAVLDWWKKNGHEVQGSQLPVNISANNCATCGDYFTVKKGFFGEPELWYWELKCGWSPGTHLKKGKMCPPLEKVDCKPFNIWELQRQFTHWAYQEELGMKIHASRVLHVYKKDGEGMVVEPRTIPSWCVGMSKKLHYASLK